MRYLKYFALVGAMIFAAGAANAQVRVGIGIGVGPGVVEVGPPPVCTWGYYAYYPYACAPYGYYGPDWFVNGVFVGAGPWYHRFYGRGYGHPFYHRDLDDRHFYRHDFDDHHFDRRGFERQGHYRGFDRGRDGHFDRGNHGGRGNEFHGGGHGHDGGHDHGGGFHRGRR